MGRVRFSAGAAGGRPPRQAPRWSAGRRRAPEAGGSRKRIVLWRAPRPKRERVVTFARVARPTTLAPPGAPLPLTFGESVKCFGKTRTRMRRENESAYPPPPPPYPPPLAGEGREGEAGEDERMRDLPALLAIPFTASRTAYRAVGWAKSSSLASPRGHGARTILPTRREPELRAVPTLPNSPPSEQLIEQPEVEAAVVGLLAAAHCGPGTGALRLRRHRGPLPYPPPQTAAATERQAPAAP